MKVRVSVFLSFTGKIVSTKTLHCQQFLSIPSLLSVFQEWMLVLQNASWQQLRRECAFSPLSSFLYFFIFFFFILFVLKFFENFYIFCLKFLKSFIHCVLIIFIPHLLPDPSPNPYLPNFVSLMFSVCLFLTH